MLSAGNGTEDDDDDGDDGGVDDDVGDDNYDDDEDLDKVDHHHRLLLAWIPRHKGLMAALGGSALGALSMLLYLVLLHAMLKRKHTDANTNTNALIDSKAHVNTNPKY